MDITSGVVDGVIKRTNLTNIIDVDAFLQSGKFFLLSDEVIFFIDCKEFQPGRFYSNVCVIDINFIETNEFRHKYYIEAYTQFNIEAAFKSKMDLDTWKNLGYCENLNKICYITSGSYTYSIVDVKFETSVEHLNDIYNDNYSIEDDMGAFFTQYTKEYDLSKINDSCGLELVNKTVNLGLSTIKYIGNIWSVGQYIYSFFDKNVSYKTDTNGINDIDFSSVKSKNSSYNGRLIRYFKDYALINKSNPYGNVTDDLVMKFQKNDNLNLSVYLHHSDPYPKMRYQTNIHLGLRHTHSLPSFDYNNEVVYTTYNKTFESRGVF